MKTIAITIDEPTLGHIDELVKGKDKAWRSRSEIIRQAVQEFVLRRERESEEERELEILRRHRSRLSRQATALVKEQAKL